MLRFRVGLLALMLALPAMAQEVLVPTGSFWRWRKGTNEVSTPIAAWRTNGFNDSTWTIGNAPFHYGSNPSGGDDGVTGGTLLPDMRNRYRGVFLRTTFTVTNRANIASVRLTANYDDGFVAWINGVEVARANVNSDPTFTSVATASHEADPAVAFTVGPSPQSYLVDGLNVLAVQALNQNLSSSTDFRFETSLAVTRVDLSVPTVLNAVPVAGATVGALTQVTVNFSKEVFGVDAADLLINGQTADLVSGSGQSYTFSFAQPSAGPVEITWSEGPLITDSLGQAFNPLAAGATWGYLLADIVAPTVAEQAPVPGAMVNQLGQLEVSFSEPVLGVDAADLRINNVAATAVTGSGAGPYVFHFTPPPAGTVQFAWAAGHGIIDAAQPANAFTGTNWTVTLDPALQTGSVVINEFVAANRTGLLDENGEAHDWIELRNRGNTTVNLAGWSLTDDEDVPGLWTFPAVNLAPGQFLVVFASGKDRRVPTGGNRHHTNFKLNPDGGYLALFNAESPRVAVTEFPLEYPEQRNDHSYGRDAGDNWRYYATPTPGTANGATTLTGVAQELAFTVGSGWFDVPFSLSIFSPDPGTTIRYTLDGSEPTASTGLVYAGPLNIAENTVLRAAAFKTGLLPSRVKTRTYLFLDQVIAQPNNPAGFPDNWGTGNFNFPDGIIPADYEMDLDPVRVDPNNAASALDPVKLQRLKDGLRELPMVSIVMNRDDMFGATGLYPTSSSANKNKNDKECAVEMVLPDGTSAFSIDGGLRLHGNASRDPHKNPKHGFKLLFKGDYGPSDLEYRLFEDSPAEEFDDLILRPDFGTSWRHWSDSPSEGLGALQRSRASRTRDAWWKDTFRDMGRLGSHSRYFHLFINGLYWGVFDFTEQPTDSFGPNYFGGSKADYDVYDQGALSSGTSAAYNAMLGLTGLENAAAYEQMKQRLDVPWFIDYMLLQFYVGAQDWGNNKNWYAIRKRVPGPEGTFKYLPWDGENILLNENINRVSTTDLPSGLHQKLDDNAEYRLAFADSVQKHLLSPGGALTAEGNIARWHKWQAILDKPIVAESARWGDYRRDVHPYQNGSYELYTREAHWMAENARMTNSYFVNRPGIVLNQLRAAGLYPNVVAPTFGQHGGRVPAGFALAMSAPAGTIHYTTNGVDPRVSGSGAVAGSARAYAGAPVALGSSMTVKARVLQNGAWSALVEADFSVGELGLPLRFTEIMYNPPGGDAHEFVELRNVGPTPVDVGRFSLEGVAFTFNEGTILQPGATVLLASSANTNAFKIRYPGAVFAGTFDNSLSNGGERLALLDRDGVVVTAVNYDDANGWPLAADGGGASLEVVDPLGDPNSPANWRASSVPHGTPGLPPAPFTLGAVQLSEVMADNVSAVGNGGQFPDYVELVNTGASTVDLSNWSLSDSSDPRAFVFPNGTSLAAGARLVVWCDLAFAAPGLHTGFGLAKSGDQVFLHDAATNRVDAVAFGAQLANLPIGRVNGVWVLNTPTPNAANLAAATAPASQLSINEWLANPLTGAADWVELFNRSTTAPAALAGLYLGLDAAPHRLLSLSFIAPGGHLQLWADEGPGADHLQFKLAAGGGTLVLHDSAGAEIERVVYASQPEGVSSGRLPDGSPNIVAFPGSGSPGVSNYVSSYTGPVFSELLARNVRTYVTPWGGRADWVELHNPGASAVALGGMALGLEAYGSDRWVFPAGVQIAANDRLVVYCAADRRASTVPEAGLNTGFNLPGTGGDLHLFNAAGQVVDHVGYGFQLDGRSIGLNSGEWRLLDEPTPGRTNAGPATLGSVSNLRINEWMASAADGIDWFELYNLDALPVDLGGLLLTDDPSAPGIEQNPIAPLSFIAGRRWVTFIADGDASLGRDHVVFSLGSSGETLRLYRPNLGLIDAVDFGAQTLGVSQGRLPDGATNVVSFPATASPDAANWLPLGEVVINEVLAHTDPPLEDAVELHNPGPTNVAIGGWYLSDSAADPKRFRIPDGTTLASGGFRVFYQNQFGPADGEDDVPPLFSFSSAHGDELHLSEADALGNLTGRRASVSFGASSNGVSFGRWLTSVGVDFTAMANRTFGVDAPASVAAFRTGTGKTNSAPLVGPVMINEIHYRPPTLAPGEAIGADAEFIELQNLTGSPVTLYDVANPANVWRLAGGITFDFPANTSIPANGRLVVVPFNPTGNAAALAAFQSRHGAGATLVGPYAGQLSNDGESVELLRPDAPQTAPHPDAGFVPYLLVDRIVYGTNAPWSAAANGGGASLQRLVASAYGNDPANWKAEAPTAGRGNDEPGDDAPVIATPPSAITLAAGGSGSLEVVATGAGPLAYQWFLGETLLPGKTDASLAFNPALLQDTGSYRVRVTNSFGVVFSAPVAVTVLAPPTITDDLDDTVVVQGQPITLRVTATGSAPLTYRWQRGGSDLDVPSQDSLAIAVAQLVDAGSYRVVVSNAVGSITSRVATLIVRVPPTITAHPAGAVATEGETISLQVSATGEAPLTYQWRKGDQPIANANQPVLELADLAPEDAGSYSVRVANAVGEAFSDPAVVVVVEAIRFGAPQRLGDGRFSTVLSGPLNQGYFVDVSTNLLDWSELTFLTLTNGPATLIDPAALQLDERFYRARKAE